MNKKTIIMLIVAGVLCFFALLAPSLFVSLDWGIDFTETGQIGDTFGGVASPFIAFAAVITTFLAFWVQFRANERQWNVLQEQKKEQNKRERMDQFERHFFALLKIHRENVKGMGVKNAQDIVSAYNGQSYFEYLTTVFNLMAAPPHTYVKIESDSAIKNVNDKQNTTKLFNLILFGEQFIHANEPVHGVKVIQNMNYVEMKWLSYFKYASNFFYDSSRRDDIILHHGHINSLSLYFRQLYQMVKFIDQKCPDENEKYEYVKRLRSTLSAHEQIILYYNILSRENEKDYEEWKEFIRKYRLIKNIPLNMVKGYSPVVWLREKLEIVKEEDLKKYFEFYQVNSPPGAAP